MKGGVPETPPTQIPPPPPPQIPALCHLWEIIKTWNSQIKNVKIVIVEQTQKIIHIFSNF